MSVDWEKEVVLNSLKEVADVEGASTLFCIDNEVIFLVCVLLIRLLWCLFQCFSTYSKQLKLRTVYY